MLVGSNGTWMLLSVRLIRSVEFGRKVGDFGTRNFLRVVRCNLGHRILICSSRNTRSDSKVTWKRHSA